MNVVEQSFYFKANGLQLKRNKNIICESYNITSTLLDNNLLEKTDTHTASII